MPDPMTGLADCLDVCTAGLRHGRTLQGAPVSGRGRPLHPAPRWRRDPRGSGHDDETESGCGGRAPCLSTCRRSQTRTSAAEWPSARVRGQYSDVLLTSTLSESSRCTERVATRSCRTGLSVHSCISARRYPSRDRPRGPRVRSSGCSALRTARSLAQKNLASLGRVPVSTAGTPE